MDMKEKSELNSSDLTAVPTSPELTSPGVMVPDTGGVPELAELVTDTTIVPAELEQQKRRKPSSPFRDSMRRLRRDKRAMASIGVIVFFILLALVGPTIYQHIGGQFNSPTLGLIGPDQYHNYSIQELTLLDQGPSAMHLLGTDNIGRDILARLMQGILISITVAFLVEVIDIFLGITVGVLAGYFGGWIDQLLARFTDLMFAFPGLLFVILLTGILGSNADAWFGSIPFLGQNGNSRLLLVSLALAFTVWPLMARYVRGQTLQLKEQQFIEAARTSGTGSVGIILHHIIPNLFSIVFIASTLNIANTIVGEAGISYLGLGVQDPGSSIGLMIAQATDNIQVYPWEIMVPTVVLAIIVVAVSFFGDGLRDAFDPRSKD